MSDWFESWFDTRYYHILYKNRDHVEARNFVKQLVSNLNIDKGAFVLDLCCGKGRHAIQLNDLGYIVHGVDLSKHSIEHAKQFESENLSFEVKDMREPLDNGPFDVVFNLFTSFGYFDNRLENEKVLKAISGYLKPDGILVIDYLNAFKISESLPLEETIVSDNITFNVRKLIHEKTIKKEISFEDEGRQYEFSERVQAFEQDDFMVMLENTGFKMVGVYGDYDLSDFDKEKSPRLIIKAKLV